MTHPNGVLRRWLTLSAATATLAMCGLAWAQAQTPSIAGAAPAAVQSPEVKKRIENEGATPVGNHPDEFARFVQSEIVRWRPVLQYAGVKPK
jgi:tripartite-type tricarboxylate transporter receptor subunit TctC